MHLINLTKDPIVIALGTDKITIEPSGKVATVQFNRAHMGIRQIHKPGTRAWHYLQIPLVAQSLKQIVGLPDPQIGNGFIVTPEVFQHVKGRSDVFMPDLQMGSKNENGNIISVPSLISLEYKT